MMDTLLIEALRTGLILVGLKAIVGFRFPWEICDCCGKKIKVH